MKNVTKISGLAVVAAFVAIQFVNRPDRTNPPEDPSLTFASQKFVPPAVSAMLERSCYDCHSNRTVWPWYSAIAPVSWLVADDVQEGRSHLNFSEWGTYKRKRQASRLEGISSEVDRDQMPLPSYVLLHSNAKLTEEDKDLLCDWADRVSDSLRTAPP